MHSAQIDCDREIDNERILASPIQISVSCCATVGGVLDPPNNRGLGGGPRMNTCSDEIRLASRDEESLDCVIINVSLLVSTCALA